MSIYKITYSEDYKRANLHNRGCNFNCDWCSYKLREQDYSPCLEVSKIKNVLRELDIERVHFVGGEPTLCEELGCLAEFAQEECKAVTKLGHSNGANVPPEYIDEANISIKTIREDIHRGHCGVPSSRVLDNFMVSYDRGIKLDASSVLIPELIDVPEIEEVARFLAGVDEEIPYHIIGYIPVPGAPWRRPTPEEMREAERTAGEYLSTITTSRWSTEEWREPAAHDPRYEKVRVA